ncbi:hypothetical protein ABZT47_24680 [Sphaerisporangium sp. NPDC005289]
MDRITTAARALLGDERFAAEFARGARLSVPEAVRHARDALGRLAPC